MPLFWLLMLLTKEKLLQKLFSCTRPARKCNPAHTSWKANVNIQKKNAIIHMVTLLPWTVSETTSKMIYGIIIIRTDICINNVENQTIPSLQRGVLFWPSTKMISGIEEELRSIKKN